jgi:triacylglycerol esterase/lipase EstA (alpha/beta hydrolase family)
MQGLSIQPLHREGSTEFLIDVFFVHGLGGDAIDTWHPARQPQDLWPKWLADDHPDMAVWTIGYPANATKWGGDGAGMALPDRGKQVLDYLIASGFGHRPIAFVAHSLGGLLVKQILRASVGLGIPKYRTIGEKTRGVIFLATPHSGSDLSGLAEGLSFLSRPTEEVKDLRANNPYLLDLADWYRNQAPNLDIST